MNGWRIQRIVMLVAGVVLAAPAALALDLLGAACVASVSQSDDATATNGAARARDGVTGTFSLTRDHEGSWWRAELIRPYAISRIEIVNRTAPYAAEMAGLTLRLMDLDDQVVHEATLSNPGAAGTWSTTFGTPRTARTVWIGLDGASTNGGGTRRVGLAEVRIYGDAALPFGPPVPGPSILPSQSSDYSAAYPASNALDGKTNTFTHTLNQTNSFWFADLSVPRALDRIELGNRADAAPKRMGGLILRVMDAASNTVATATVTNPGAGRVWTYYAPANTTGRYVRVGLEGGVTNGDGNFYVTLAEARFFSGTNQLPALGYAVPSTGVVNYAVGATSWMVRLTSTLAPASNANDGVYATEAKTTMATVDGYWEVDLGATYALYGVRTIAASGIGSRMTNTTLRLYDAEHKSVFSKMLAGTPDAFDTDVGGPVFARYVRVGLEDKRRTSPTGATEWYIGMREVEVFGRATNEVGILGFTASATNVAPGGSVALSWNVEDVRRVEIHPGVGSVGAQTDTAGQGSLVMAPTSSVEYVMIASNAAGVFSRSVGVTVGGAPLPLRISEFVADNKFSLEDGHGEAPDWIELRNPGNAPVDLAGWGLSDDPALPFRFVLPATNLAPHETLIVFASGRATPVDPAGHLHAPFRLDSAGGSLVLTAPGGATADAITNYPAQETDLAYGRDLEGRICFLEPTPRRVNAATTYEGWLSPVEFSHKRGFYDEPFTLVISNNNPGAEVWLAYDGSPPTNPCPASIAVSRTRTIRALVAKPGHRSPRIKTHTYVFVDSVITSATMSTNVTQDARYAPRMRQGLLALPSVCVSLTGVPTYDEAEGSIEILWPGGGTEPVQANCGISRFGSSYQSFTKQSFRAKFRPDYGTRKLEAPLFGGFDRGILAKTSFDEIDLRAGNQDMNARGFYMAGRFVEDSMLDMGSLNPHGRFVHVYLNGAYWGQYDMRELLVDRMLADYLGGAAEDYVTVRGNDNVVGAFVLGAPEPPNVAPWETARSLRGNYAALKDRVDVPNLVDFMLLWFYGNCESEYRSAGPLAPGSGFKFWMADADGFLRTNALTVNTTASTGPGDLFGGLNTESNAEFRTLLADRIHRHLFNDGAMTPASNEARLTARMDEIRDSLLAECARWGNQTPTSWDAAAALIKSLLFPVRTTQLVAQVRARGYYPALDAPAFGLYGGLATNGYLPVMNAPSGTIYFTTDGSDPRLAGGGTSLSARVWTPGGLVVSQDVTVSARVLAPDGTWSALAAPRFLLAGRAQPGPRDLLVTEIHYNPVGDDSTEFVELHNSGTNLLDLSGVALTNGVRFVFPPDSALAPGLFAIVAEDTNAFRARYQDPSSPWYRADLVVAGVWAGSLANEGETVAVAASNGTVLLSIPYGTGGDWPERADGDGSSLELRALPLATNDGAAVAAYMAQGRNWTSSSRYHGSPGRFDDYARSVRIAEALTHTDAETDWLEIENRGATGADLSGLWLTDDADLPQRFRIPDGTVVPPGDRVSFGAAQLGFAFSELGGAAMLLEMAGTNVVRFLDTVDFPAAAREEPFGLYERSDGDLDFTELRAATRDSANALPRVGPLVISEIHCAPTNGLAPFIEISNLSTSAVPLYHPSFPTNVWRIEGLGPYAFPTNTTLAPLESVLVCATNPAELAAQYGVEPGIRVFGPWPGALDADGETLKLLRPGDPEPDGFVPYYRADHFAFRVAAPWPVPSAGRSIERTPVEAYGNDPASWREGTEQGSPGAPRANRPPSVNAPDLSEAAEGSSVTVSVFAVDLDVPWQAVSLGPAALPGGAAFDAGRSAMTWTPGELDGATTQAAAFVATDTALTPSSVTGETRIAVAEVNEPPVWTPRDAVAWPAGTPLRIHVSAADPDLPAQVLSFRGEGLPEGLEVDPQSGALAGTCAATGMWAVALLVSDGGSPALEATNRFIVRASPPFVLDLRAAPGQGTLLSFPALADGAYVIEASGSLTPPDWQPVATVSNAPADLLEWSDPPSGSASSRFFRVRWRAP